MAKFKIKLQPAGLKPEEAPPVEQVVDGESIGQVRETYEKHGLFEVLDVQPLDFPVPQLAPQGQALSQQVASIPVQTNTTPVVTQTTKYFTDAGVDFKIENHQLYKKDWVEIQGTEAGNYSILVGKNSKRTLLCDAKVRLFKIDWIAIGEKE